MRSRMLPALAGAAVLAGITVAAAPADKAPATASEFYLKYVTVMDTMKSLDEIMPYFAKAQAEMMGRMPKEMHGEVMAGAKKEVVTGVRILKESPFDKGFLVEAEGTRKADKAKAKGWAVIIKEDGVFKLERDNWSGEPPPAPPVAPKIPASVAQPGTAAGEWTVNGKTSALKYAWVEATPDSFDPKKTGYRLILSDVPWNPSDYSRDDKVKAGTLHYLELSLGSEKQLYGSMLYHGAFKDTTYLSSAGGDVEFEAASFGPDVVAGKVYMKAPENGIGGVRYYAATFKAAVAKPKK